jgi:hypothetical protein
MTLVVEWKSKPTPAEEREWAESLGLLPVPRLMNSDGTRRAYMTKKDGAILSPRRIERARILLGERAQSMAVTRLP